MANNSTDVVVDDSHIVTEFLLTTCVQQPDRNNVYAAIMCENAAAQGPIEDKEAENFPLITRSTAEMYIRPMLS